MNQPTRPFPLATNEEVLIHGANAVGGAPRDHFPAAGAGAVYAVLALVIAAVAWRREGGRRVLGVLLLLAAAPGLVAVLALRADAPLNRGELAREVTGTLDQLTAQAGWPAHPVTVAGETDDVLFPLLRYALPGRPDGDAGTLRIQGEALRATCERVGDAVVCGVAP